MFSRLSITLCTVAALSSLGVLAEHIVIRDSHVTIPTLKKVSTSGMANVLKADQSRAQHKLKTSKQDNRRSTRAAALETVPITNYATQYLINVTIGDPPQSCTHQYLDSSLYVEADPSLVRLQVDTGSANTWFGAGQYLAPPPSAKNTGQDLDLEYGGDAIMIGSEWIDQIQLAPGFTIYNQSLGLSLAAVGFQDGIDGILGYVVPPILDSRFVHSSYNRVGPEVLTYGS